MLTLFRKVGHFLNNMDARAITSMLVTLVLLAVAVLLMARGAEWLGVDGETVERLMSRIAASPYAIVGVIAVYCVLALLGFPQMLLIVGTVAVFGATQGAAYSWIATMVSATFTFAIGHVFGGGFVKKLSAGRAATMIEVVRRHGLFASMIVRVTPSAPFIVINAICGAAHISILKFWAGTALGILPKILFLSVFTQQAGDILAFFKSRDPQDLGIIVVIVVAWLVFLVAMRALYMHLRKTALGGLSE